MFWDLIIASAPRGEKKNLHTEAVSVCLWAKGAEVLLPPQKSSAAVLLRATSVYGFAKKSLVHVPDFGQQRRKLLVLEAEGKYLLRVDTAERAQAHQLHQHARKHQVILRRHLTPSLIRPRRWPHVPGELRQACHPLQGEAKCSNGHLRLVSLSWCKSAGGPRTAAAAAPPDRDPAHWGDLTSKRWLVSDLSDGRMWLQAPVYLFMKADLQRRY